jgi:hypothetical protein
MLSFIRGVSVLLIIFTPSFLLCLGFRGCKRALVRVRDMFDWVWVDTGSRITGSGGFMVWVIFYEPVQWVNLMVRV